MSYDVDRFLLPAPSFFRLTNRPKDTRTAADSTITVSPRLYTALSWLYLCVLVLALLYSGYAFVEFEDDRDAEE